MTNIRYGWRCQFKISQILGLCKLCDICDTRVFVAFRCWNPCACCFPMRLPLLFCWSCHVSPLLWSYVWKVTNIMGCSLFIVQLPCARSLFLRTVVPVRWLPWNLSIITDPIPLVHIIHFPESVWWWCCTPESWGRRMGEDKGVWGEGGRSKGMQLHTGK